MFRLEFPSTAAHSLSRLEGVHAVRPAVEERLIAVAVAGAGDPGLEAVHHGG